MANKSKRPSEFRIQNSELGSFLHWERTTRDSEPGDVQSAALTGLMIGILSVSGTRLAFILEHTLMTMKIMRNAILAFALTGVALATVACPEKGPAEKAGEKIDDAVDKTKDAVK
jgi:hypothetical protein